MINSDFGRVDRSDAPLDKNIRVIEYSNYESAVRERNEAREELAEYRRGNRECPKCGSYGNDVEKHDLGYTCKCGCQWASLEQIERARAKKLVEALDMIAVTHVGDFGDHWKNSLQAVIDIAKKAVAVYEWRT